MHHPFNPRIPGFLTPPAFNPVEGTTIFKPPGDGPGYWAGAPSAMYDEEREEFLISYRHRRPIELGRGFECLIAASPDGINFKTIWTVTKEELNARSIERPALVKIPGGTYRLYTSIADNHDHRWRIEMLEAETPENFPHEPGIPVLTPDGLGVEGVKDPYVIFVGGTTYLYAAYAVSGDSGQSWKDLHTQHGDNVFTLQTVYMPTGLAVSSNGRDFEWTPDVLSPGPGWDRNQTRVCALLPMERGFICYYDGETGGEDAYDERTGIAVTFDLINFQRLSLDGPYLQSSGEGGCLRYLDCVPKDNELFFYYEYAREDGAHETRMNRVKL